MEKINRWLLHTEGDDDDDRLGFVQMWSPTFK